MTRRQPSADGVSGGQITGITGDAAGFAEKMLTHENGFVKIPKEVPLGSAALIGCAVVTGVGAVMNTAKVEAGSSVAVFGVWSDEGSRWECS